MSRSGTGQRCFPHEVAANRPAQLELVSGLNHIGEIWRDLPALEPIDREHDATVLGCRRDRVAALRLVPVVCREADVDVLSGAVTGPVRQVEHEALRAAGLIDRVHDSTELPAQSPW